MPTTEQQQRGGVYQVRRLDDRWVQPMGGDVLSTHDSERAAFAAYDRESQIAADGTGRSTAGSFVPRIVIRVNTDGSESVAVRRTGGGRW